jgi:outer membrane protein assembly factor BamD
MLQDFPDSPLIPRAKQRLREVQEVQAQRQFEIGMFYASREEWPGAIARLQTVSDTYPLFSHSDQTLITLGDAYATEANVFSQARQLSPQARAELVKVYNDQAAAAWERVVTRYPMAPHVEDAKDRLIAMGRDVPEPTQQQLAQSEAEEGSRINVKLKDRAMLLIKHGPSTVQAARVGDPTLTDPSPTLAPDVTKQSQDLYKAALENKPLTPLTPAGGEQTGAATAAAGTAAPASNQAPAATLQLETVPDQGGTAGSTVTVEVPNGGSEPANSNGTGSAAVTGAEVVSAPAAGTSPTPVVGGPGPLATGATDSNGAYTGAPPAGTGAAVNAKPAVEPVGPPVNKPLPPIDKPAPAPNQINDVTSTPKVNTATAPNKKAKKAPYNSKDESSSKHKKKKGLDKLNPF